MTTIDPTIVPPVPFTPGATADDIAHFSTPHGRRIELKIRQRIVVERAIIRKAVTDIIAAGYALSVDYGEDDVAVSRSSDVAEIMEAIGACDEEWLHVRHTNGKLRGTIALVYGNDGWDVICDYHTSLEPLLTGANELAEQLS